VRPTGGTASSSADNDVDLFFDYDDPRFSLVELVRLRRQIADILGVEAGVMTRDSLHPTIKRRIEASAIRIF
jgi:predicted nucleotidyltransferase